MNFTSAVPRGTLVQYSTVQQHKVCPRAKLAEKKITIQARCSVLPFPQCDVTKLALLFRNSGRRFYPHRNVTNT